MSPLFRQILIRLLLLSLLFAAAVASPLHSAMHMQHTAANEEIQLIGQEQGHEHDAVGLCDWCLSPAMQTSGWPAPPPPLAMAASSSRTHCQVAAPAMVYRPNPGRWPFSSRDPPRA